MNHFHKRLENNCSVAVAYFVQDSPGVSICYTDNPSASACVRAILNQPETVLTTYHLTVRITVQEHSLSLAYLFP